MGKLSRDKGAAMERRVANWLNAVLEESPLVSFVRELRETQQGNIGDVRDKTGSFPFVIQCKHMKKPSPFKAMQEAREGALQSLGRSEAGVAIIRRQGGENMVCMRPDTFAAMLLLMDDACSGVQASTKDGRPAARFWEKIYQIENEGRDKL